MWQLRSRFLLVVFLAILAVHFSTALVCFDCHGTGPSHEACTSSRNCSGAACLIFDAGDGLTQSAFCLLSLMEETPRRGCWMEADGKGRHCICTEDFCNELVDTRTLKGALPLKNASLLDKNPLVDYDSSESEGSKPLPSNVLFPGADEADPDVAGVALGKDDDDLVPVDFEAYDLQLKNADKAAEATAESGQTSSSRNPTPPAMLIFLSMSASIARFLGF